MLTTKHAPKLENCEIIAASDFLELRRLTWRDSRDRVRHWDAAGRRSRQGAVVIIATLQPDDAVILVKQYRPPAGAYMLEFPAGLLEPGEEPESAALRELSEETGYTGKIVASYPPAFNTPGMSDETVAIVVMNVNSADYRDTPPVSHQEDSEDIETIVVPRRELLGYIGQAYDAGVKVDSKLVAYALLP